jgi:heme o synthase
MNTSLQGAMLPVRVGISNAEPADFFALMKPRVMALVVFTALVGLVIAPGGINPVLAGIAIFAIAIGGGASGALNMWHEAALDAVMRRTAKRPIPAGRVSREEALAFGLVTAVFSVMVLGLATNWLASSLLAFTIFFYAVPYTMWLKPRTAQNIVIGGAAGALPPVIGWAAVTGSVAWEPLVLFALIFLWTPPHFWALALVRSDDYAKAGIPMLPLTAGAAHTRWQILAYSCVLAPFALLPVLMGFGFWLYAATALVGGGMMLLWAINILRFAGTDQHDKACWKMFGGSILYLFALFAALLLERIGLALAPYVTGFFA